MAGKGSTGSDFDDAHFAEHGMGLRPDARTSQTRKCYGRVDRVRGEV